MQAELVALQPQLVKTVAEVEALMERIAHDKKHEVGGDIWKRLMVGKLDASWSTAQALCGEGLGGPMSLLGVWILLAPIKNPGQAAPSV